MIKSISIHDFINLPESVPLIDVRTPLEFQQGRIPGAFNVLILQPHPAPCEYWVSFIGVDSIF